MDERDRVREEEDHARRRVDGSSTALSFARMDPFDQEDLSQKTPRSVDVVCFRF